MDSDDFRISKPFDMDLLHFYPLRGSLGRKPERATQAKVRAREKYKKEEAKTAKRKKKNKKRKMQRKERKKSKKKKEMKRIEKKRKTKLARSKTCNRRLGKS